MAWRGGAGVLCVLIAAALAAGEGGKQPAPGYSRPKSRVPAAARAKERLPAWARERPHFFEQNGHVFAAAVGRARLGDLALARATAQDRARADLLRLIQGKSPRSTARGVLRGARVTDMYASRRGPVYVRVEVEAEAR